MFQWLVEKSLANRLFVLAVSVVLMAMGRFRPGVCRSMSFLISTNRPSR
jgi:hypothetical protein